MAIMAKKNYEWPGPGRRPAKGNFNGADKGRNGDSDSGLGFHPLEGPFITWEDMFFIIVRM